MIKGFSSGKFHWLFLSEEDGGAGEFYDKPLHQTENFIVLPSLGSIVPGWLLVVPKKPVTRFADLPISVSAELHTLLLFLKSQIEEVFGNSYLFEHGGYEGSLISCGVDQAHMHLVPLNFDLLQTSTSQKGLSWTKIELNQLPDSLNTKKEYLFVSSFSESYMCELNNPESQWFRKLIAEKNDCPEKWDYREHAFPENIKKTIKNVRWHVG